MSRQPITIFDRETGAILRWRMIDFGRQPIILPPEWDWIAGRLDDGQHRIDPATREPIELTQMPIEVSHGMLTGIPVGTTARVKLQKHPGTIDDGLLELDAEWPETIDVTLTHPLWLPWEGQVTCGPTEG